MIRLFFVLFCFSFFLCSVKPEITTGTLLLEMIDRDGLTRFPDPEYTIKQFSSYDRKTVSPNKPGWFANADRSQFIRTEFNDGRREFVILDAEGPGAIVRFWITVALYEGNGILRFYIDHDPEPVLEGEVLKIMSGGGIVSGPLANSVSKLTEYIKRGHNLYFPIPYSRHCKITYESAGIDASPGAISGEAFYYNINYRTYQPGIKIRSFSREDLINYKDEIDMVQETFINYCEGFPEHLSIKKVDPTTLTPGNVIQSEIIGAKAITELIVKINAEFFEQALRSTVLEMTFDDNQTVWCPLGDFFGTGYKLSPYQTRYSLVEDNGTMSSRWIMPFRKNGIVKIKNFGSQNVSLEKFHVVFTDYKWSDKSMYFGAGWREDNRISTRAPRKNMDEEEAGRFDVNYVKLEGKGVLVGNGVTLFNTTDAWWGEGDEKIFIDGESFPSHIGTGTEDFYGYAWSNPNKFDHPFIAQPDGSGAMEPGYVVNLRYRALDAIPFNQSLKFDMEIWHQAETVINHAPISYWYIVPGGNSNLKPVPDLVERPVALSRMDFYLDGYAERNVFIDKSLVTINGRENDLEIRYTLDGSNPTSGSKLYTGPFKLKKSTIIKSIGFSKKGYATEILEGKFIKQKPISGTNLTNPKMGIKYQYFELDDIIQSTNELSNYSVQKTGITKSLSFPNIQLPLKFGLVYSGYVHVKMSGVYSFSTISNDGSVLYIHNQLIVRNDGPHGSRERSGQIALAPGYHPIKLEYMQIGGSRDLEVYIEGPEIDKRVVLATEVFH